MTLVVSGLAAQAPGEAIAEIPPRLQHLRHVLRGQVARSHPAVPEMRRAQRARHASGPLIWGRHFFQLPACEAQSAWLVKGSFEWKPQYENLEIIVRTALNWEKQLEKKAL